MIKKQVNTNYCNISSMHCQDVARLTIDANNLLIYVPLYL